MPNNFNKDWIQDWKRKHEMGLPKCVLMHGLSLLVIATFEYAFVNEHKVWEMMPFDSAKTLALYLAGGLA